MKSFVCSVALALLAGCTTELSRRDAEANIWKQSLPASNADYGQYPNNYQEIIKSDLARTLKDPASARYGNFSRLRKEHIIENFLAKQATYGYSACVQVNAKNSYGGYSGNHRFWYFIRNGSIIRSQDTDVSGDSIYLGRSIDCRDGEM